MNKREGFVPIVSEEKGQKQVSTTETPFRMDYLLRVGHCKAAEDLLFPRTQLATSKPSCVFILLDDS